jgi:hypothetical protein
MAREGGAEDQADDDEPFLDGQEGIVGDRGDLLADRRLRLGGRRGVEVADLRALR